MSLPHSKSTGGINPNLFRFRERGVGQQCLRERQRICCPFIWSVGPLDMKKRLFLSSQIQNTVTLFKQALFEVSGSVISCAGSRCGVVGAQPRACVGSWVRSHRHAWGLLEKQICAPLTHTMVPLGKDRGNVLAESRPRVISLQQAAYSSWQVGATVVRPRSPSASILQSQGLYSSGLLLYTGWKTETNTKQNKKPKPHKSFSQLFS